MRKNKTIILSVFFSLFAFFTLHAAPNTSLIEREEVKAFVEQMVQKHQFDHKQLNQWLSQATIQSSILDAVAKPAEKLPWHRYQNIFLTQDRIQEGVNFWKTHAKTLKQAEQKYGIPPEIIIAIIGVETFYGKRTGQYKVLDSLVTLGFNYPPRSQFYLSELEHFLLLAREENWDLNQIKGSYAGAMGAPQFISSSYRHFAVDFNGNGKRDLLQGIDDSIGSVANYFRQHGWQSHGPVVFPAKANPEKCQSIIASKSNPKPSHTLAQMAQFGVTTGIKNPKMVNQSFALIALEGDAGNEYWLGAQNFYVITRYNRSDHYAMAVYNLSEKIKEAYLKNV